MAERGERANKRLKRNKAVKRAALPDELENPETYGVRVGAAQHKLRRLLQVCQRTEHWSCCR